MQICDVIAILLTKNRRRRRQNDDEINKVFWFDLIWLDWIKRTQEKNRKNQI